MSLNYQCEIYTIANNKLLIAYIYYIEGFVFTEPSFYYYKFLLQQELLILFPFSYTNSLMKSSYFERYARSHRPLRTLTSVDTNAHIGRSKTTLFKIFRTSI